MGRRETCWCRASTTNGWRALFGAALGVVVGGLAAEDVVHGREARDVGTGDLPRLLNDPRERAVLPGGLFLDLPEHVFGEVEALLALVRAGHGISECQTGLS